jgi:hypothetical protein
MYYIFFLHPTNQRRLEIYKSSLFLFNLNFFLFFFIYSFTHPQKAKKMSEQGTSATGKLDILRASMAGQEAKIDLWRDMQRRRDILMEKINRTIPVLQQESNRLTTNNEKRNQWDEEDEYRYRKITKALIETKKGVEAVNNVYNKDRALNDTEVTMSILDEYNSVLRDLNQVMYARLKWAVFSMVKFDKRLDKLSENLSKGDTQSTAEFEKTYVPPTTYTTSPLPSDEEVNETLNALNSQSQVSSRRSRPERHTSASLSICSKCNKPCKM